MAAGRGGSRRGVRSPPEVVLLDCRSRREFALRLLNHADAANFAGSWYEWEADPENPVQTGE